MDKSSPQIPMVTQPWEDPETVLRHADKARAAGDTVRAFTFYSRLIELNPNDARGWAGKAATTTDPNEAIISWAYALALAPDNLEAHAELDAQIAKKIKLRRADDIQEIMSLGRTLAGLDQKPWAYRLFVRATELDPLHEEAWLWRAGVTDNIKETISCLNQALALNPRNKKAQVGLQWALSKQASQASLKPTTAPEDATRLFEEGQIALADADVTRAHDFFVRATKLNPKNEAGWIWRASTATDKDEALYCIDQALILNPGNEAAKDTRWWLQIQKLREQTGSRTHIRPVPGNGSTPSDGAPASQHEATKNVARTAERAPAAPPAKKSNSATQVLVIVVLVLIILALAAALAIVIFHPSL